MAATVEGVGQRPLVVALDDPDALDPSLVGAKAAALAAARRAGLPVLPGNVLTTALPPDGVGLAGLAAWQSMSRAGSRPVVVRSSSTIEDGHSQSMAGLFTSVVGVRTLSDFTAATQEVLASGKVVPLAHGAPLAVLVQPLLDARVGGVVFGLDPVSGRTDRLVLAAAAGGPVALVQGEAAGDYAALTRRGRLVGGATLLSPAQLRQLAGLSRRAADLFGGPQDIEWAVDTDGKLWVLQSRPVTAVAGVATRPVLGPGPVAETFPDPLARLEADLWVEPLRVAVSRALRLVAATSAAAIRRSPVVTTAGGRVAVDLELFGALTSRRRGLARLDPRPPVRRLLAAWRVGRLRVALPGLVKDLVERADDELRAVPPLREVTDEAALALLDGAGARLTALHGHEVLMGWLVAPQAASVTAASVALRLLAAARAEGLSDEEAVSRHPSVLALVPPRIGVGGPLPASDPVTPLPVGDDAGVEDEAAVLREALRLRARWVHELSARVAHELGRRLSQRGVLAQPELVRWLGREELAVAVRSGVVPADLAERAAKPAAAPLPARFRLAPGGVVVAASSRAGDGRTSPSGAQGAAGGRASGVVYSGVGPPPEGSVLVVRTLDPGLAPWLSRLAALVAETGSPLSHLAILAREYGVPTVVGVEDALQRFRPGTLVLVDGTTGEVTSVREAERGAA